MPLLKKTERISSTRWVDPAQRRAEADAIRARAAAGEDFAALAKEASQAGTRDNGGLLGTIHKGDIAPELEAVAFSIPIGSRYHPERAPLWNSTLGGDIETTERWLAESRM